MHGRKVGEEAGPHAVKDVCGRGEQRAGQGGEVAGVVPFPAGEQVGLGHGGSAVVGGDADGGGEAWDAVGGVGQERQHVGVVGRSLEPRLLGQLPYCGLFYGLLGGQLAAW